MTQPTTLQIIDMKIDCKMSIITIDNHDEIKPYLMKHISYAPSQKINSVDRTDWSLADEPNRGWITGIIPTLMPMLESYAREQELQDVHLNKIWFQQYEKGGEHGWHNHWDNYSGVYFLDKPDGAPTTEFINPVTKEIICPDVKEGQMILFPAFVLHRAPKNVSEQRTIISFNFNMDGYKTK